MIEQPWVDLQVEKAERGGDAIVFLAWSPHRMTVQFKTVFLDDPDGVWGGAGAIRTVTRAGLAHDAPDINTFLTNLTFTPDEAGQFYFDHDKSGMELSEIASTRNESRLEETGCCSFFTSE